MKYFLDRYWTDKDSVMLNSQNNDLNTTNTYQRLWNFSLKNDKTKIHHEGRVYKFLEALMEKDHGYLELHATHESCSDVIVSCYLYILRRYPGQNDIDLWMTHLANGATLYTILNTLKNSLEFQNTGAYYLPKEL